MNKRTAFWLAWSIWILYLIIAIITLLFQMKNDPSSLPTDIFGALVLLAFATVGALIASQRPQNPIGWIFCAGALLSTLGTLLLEYTSYAFITAPGSLPAGALVGVFGGWARSIGWLLTLTSAPNKLYLACRRYVVVFYSVTFLSFCYKESTKLLIEMWTRGNIKALTLPDLAC